MNGRPPSLPLSIAATIVICVTRLRDDKTISKQSLLLCPSGSLYSSVTSNNVTVFKCAVLLRPRLESREDNYQDPNNSVLRLSVFRDFLFSHDFLMTCIRSISRP